MDLGFFHFRLRCLLVWAMGTLVAVSTTLAMTPVLHGPRARFDEALVWGCAAVAVAVTVWLWLVVTVVTIDAARGAPRIRRGASAWVRASTKSLPTRSSTTS